MQKQISFSYFYGRESGLFSYYRIPRLLVTGSQFKDLSTDAKLLYGLLLDRMSLSAKNGWYDSAELDSGTGIGMQKTYVNSVGMI